MVDPHLVCQLGGIIALVIVLTIVKANGKGLLPRKIGCHVAGIHAAGQEAAHLHVADAVGGHGIGEHLVDGVHRLFDGHILIGGEHGLPIPLHRYLAVLIDEIMGGGQTGNALEEGLGGNRVLEGQILVQCGGIKLLFDVGMTQNGFDLRAIHQTAVLQQRIMHRLNAEIVTGDE